MKSIVISSKKLPFFEAAFWLLIASTFFLLPDRELPRPDWLVRSLRYAPLGALAAIVLPEIIASLGFGWVMKNVLNNDRLAAVQIGGVLMIIAAGLCYFLIKEKD